jgi:aminopeptidase
MAGPMRPDELARYADAIVRVALRLRKGDELVVNAEPGHGDVAVGLVDAAYRAGARYAEVQYADPRVRAAQVRGAPEDALGWVTPARATYFRWRERPEVAAVNVLGETDTDALKGLDPERIALDATGIERHLPWMREPRRGRRRRWVFVDWPTQAWARLVYPNLKPANAERRLAQDLLWFSRLGPGDPPDAPKAHLDGLERRAKRLSRLRLERLDLRGPGTELQLRLPPGVLWGGPWLKNDHGRVFAANYPMEEVFTSPDAAGTEGVFRCSRPIRWQGRLVDGLEGEFRGGRLVRLRARGRDGDFLRRYLAGIRNGDRLGEVALVDSSSRIGQAGRLYYETLLDENAVAHMAFGDGLAETRPTGRGGGLNRSDVHCDVMLGSDELEATGVKGRRRIPLIRDGAWQL